MISICKENGKPFEKYQIELANVQQTIPEQKSRAINEDSTPSKARPIGSQQSNLNKESNKNESNDSNFMVASSTSTRKVTESPIEDTDHDTSDEDVTILLP